MQVSVKSQQIHVTSHQRAEEKPKIQRDDSTAASPETENLRVIQCCQVYGVSLILSVDDEAKVKMLNPLPWKQKPKNYNNGNTG